MFYKSFPTSWYKVRGAMKVPISMFIYIHSYDLIGSIAGKVHNDIRVEKQQAWSL